VIGGVIGLARVLVDDNTLGSPVFAPDLGVDIVFAVMPAWQTPLPVLEKPAAHITGQGFAPAFLDGT
jgi:hypothetical protein